MDPFIDNRSIDDLLAEIDHSQPHSNPPSGSSTNNDLFTSIDSKPDIPLYKTTNQSQVDTSAFNIVLDYGAGKHKTNHANLPPTQQSTSATQLYNDIFISPNKPVQHNTINQQHRETPLPRLEQSSPLHHRLPQTPLRCDSRVSNSSSMSTLAAKQSTARLYSDLNTIQQKNIRLLNVPEAMVNIQSGRFDDSIINQTIKLYQQLIGHVSLEEQLRQQRHSIDHITIELYLDYSMVQLHDELAVQTVYNHRVTAYRYSQCLIPILSHIIASIELGHDTNQYDNIKKLLQYKRIWCVIQIDPLITDHFVRRGGVPRSVNGDQCKWISSQFRVVNTNNNGITIINQSLNMINTDIKKLSSRDKSQYIQHHGTGQIIQLQEQIIDIELLSATHTNIRRTYKLVLVENQCNTVRSGDYIHIVGSCTAGAPQYDNLFWDNYQLRPNRLPVLDIYIVANTISRIEDTMNMKQINSLQSVFNGIRCSENILQWVKQPIFGTINYLNDYLLTSVLIDTFLIHIAPVQMYRKLKLQLLLTLVSSQTESVATDQLTDDDITINKQHTKLINMNRLAHDRLTMLIYSNNLVTAQLVDTAAKHHTRSMKIQSLDQITSQSKQYVTLFNTQPISEHDLQPIQNCIDSNIIHSHDIQHTNPSTMKRRKLKQSTNGVSLIYNTVLADKSNKIKSKSMVPLNMTEYKASCLFDMTDIIASRHNNHAYELLETAQLIDCHCLYDRSNLQFIQWNQPDMIPLGQSNQYFDLIKDKLMNELLPLQVYLTNCRALKDIQFSDAAADLARKYYLACRELQRKHPTETNGVKYDMYVHPITYTSIIESIILFID